MSSDTFPYTAAGSEEEEKITSPACFKGRQGRANVKSAVSRVCFNSADAEDGGSRHHQSEDHPRTKAQSKETFRSRSPVTHAVSSNTEDALEGWQPGIQPTTTPSVSILKPDLFSANLVSQVAASKTSSIRSEFQDLLKSRDNKFLATSKDIEDLRAQQKNSILLAEATGLRSEGSRRQFAAFAKVKTGISDARRLLQNHNIHGALGVLETAEKVTDIRLDVIKRADSVPGDGWEAAGSYENCMLGDADA
jgi:hypothetical protein